MFNFRIVTVIYAEHTYVYMYVCCCYFEDMLDFLEYSLISFLLVLLYQF